MPIPSPSPEWAGAVLGRLFSHPAGTWVPVSCLCETLGKVSDAYQSLTADMEEEIVATWLPHPFEPTDAFLVTFYQDDELASYNAIVTKHYLHILEVVTA